MSLSFSKVFKTYRGVILVCEDIEGGLLGQVRRLMGVILEAEEIEGVHFGRCRD